MGRDLSAIPGQRVVRTRVRCRRRSANRPNSDLKHGASRTSGGLNGCVLGRGRNRAYPDGLPVRSFRTLLDDLSGMALNQLRMPGHGECLLFLVTATTPVHERAFRLLGVMPDQCVPARLPG